MARLLKRRDLDPSDLAALRDLVRFGVMADDQIARRYPEPALAYRRLPWLKDGGIVFRWRESLEGSRCYSPTGLGRHLADVSSVVSLTTSESHLPHDVAVVDLADVLVANDPGVRWLTEREVRPFLDQIGPSPRTLPGDIRHRPDGLLLSPTERIAVELEHSDKFEYRYLRISRWFAREWRLDRVRWYVDNSTIVTRLREVNAQHGFDRDIQIEVDPFPPGVRLRHRLGRFDP
jgi:hypothetical protein